MSKAKERTEPPKNQSKIKSRIREVAEKQGIKSSYGLQMLLSTGEKIVAPTVAVNLWNDDVTRFSVETLELLCEKLSCDVGDLLVYESNAKRSKPVAVSESVKGAPVKVELEKSVETPPVVVSSDNESLISSVPVGDDDKYTLTSADAGRLLDLSPRTVREYAEKGTLKGKQGKQNHWFFRSADIVDFIAQRESE